MSTPTATPIAVVSHLYPSRTRPNYGVFVYEQTRALVDSGCPVTAVAAPVPWAPWPLPSLSQQWARYAGAERSRTDFGAVPVAFPRYLSLPRKWLRGYSAWTAARSILRYPALGDAMRRSGVIVAHTALLDGNVARHISKKTGVPYVVVVHGEDVYQNLRGPQAATLARLVEAALDGASAIIAVSEPLADALADALPALPRAHVLPNGVDVDLFSPAPPRLPSEEEPLRILSAGHLVERKAHAFVLRAVAELAGAGVAVRYTIAGDGPERERLQALADQLGIADNVRFLGAYRHEELPALMQDADIFALPSWDEAFGVVYLEALACGVPVIAADNGGATTIMRDGVEGYLVPARDHAALAAAIRRFLDIGPSGRATMQAAARATSLDFTWEANARELMNILRESAS